MKIEDLQKLGSERILTLEQLPNNGGDGTVENPIVIQPSELLPKHLRIKESSLFVHFSQCSFNLLSLKKCQNIKLLDCELLNELNLKNCQNIKIDDCAFESLSLEKDLNIEIKNCKFHGSLALVKSQHLTIRDCNINLLRLTNSHNNSFSDCIVNSAINDFSRANLFERIKFTEKSDKYLKELLKSSTTRRVYLYAILMVITMAISGTLTLWRIDSVEALWFLSILILAIMVGVINYSLIYFKTKKYELNKIL